MELLHLGEREKKVEYLELIYDLIFVYVRLLFGLLCRCALQGKTV